MWLVLCHAGDPSAAWAAVGLRRRGLDPVELVAAEELMAGSRLTHAVSGREATVRLRLRDGRLISSDGVRGVVNRLAGVPPLVTAALPEGDRGYATEERAAATASWLAALPCPVLNRPTPSLLTGVWRREPEWRQLALAAGLPIEPWWAESNSGRHEEAGAGESAAEARALVVGSRVVGASEPSVVAGLVQLGEIAGTPLLDVALAGEWGGWRFRSASPLPELPRFGEEALDALAAELGGPT